MGIAISGFQESCSQFLDALCCLVWGEDEQICSDITPNIQGGKLILGGKVLSQKAYWEWRLSYNLTSRCWKTMPMNSFVSWNGLKAKSSDSRSPNSLLKSPDPGCLTLEHTPRQACQILAEQNCQRLGSQTPLDWEQAQHSRWEQDANKLLPHYSQTIGELILREWKIFHFPIPWSALHHCHLNFQAAFWSFVQCKSVERESLQVEALLKAKMAGKFHLLRTSSSYSSHLPTVEAGATLCRAHHSRYNISKQIESAFGNISSVCLVKSCAIMRLALSPVSLKYSCSILHPLAKEIDHTSEGGCIALPQRLLKFLARTAKNTKPNPHRD